MKMVRESHDLCITVPNYFRCPISLDVMKSPVSLCTGVTYDRTSIRRWLDSGHNTCPATMQLLHTKDLVPNRTLHSLIQIWSNSNSLNHPLHSPASNSLVPSKNKLLQAVAEFKSCAHNLHDSLDKIVLFAQNSQDNREFLAKLDGFVDVLVRFLGNAGAGVAGSVGFIGQVMTALGLVLEKIEDREGLKNSLLKVEMNGNCLDSLLLVLRNGTSNSRIASAKVLSFIAVDSESKRLIAEKEGMITELLNLSSPENDSVLIESCLSALVVISSPKRNKLKLVSAGAIKRFSKLLSEPNLNASVVEKVLKLVETASSTREGRKEICEEKGFVAAVLNKALKVSKTATEHAVTTLWSVCYLFQDRKAQEAVTNGSGLMKILLLMQSNCSPPVRLMCVDLLKIFRVNSKSCVTCYDTKTTHIMPF